MTDLEAVRLHALQDYAILDTPREEAFDRIVHLAAVALDMPVVLIPFLDEERQWFKASYGIPISQTARTAGLCHETIKHANVTIVRDIHADPRYQDPGFIAGDRSLRFYAAAPLVVPGGEIIGTLCVMDRKLRPDFGARETEVLKDLAALVLNQLGLRRDRLMLERERDEISLIRDIAGLLTDTCSFEAALQASMRKIVGAMGGAYCEIWERHEGESAARLIAFIAADAAREERFAPMQTRLRKALTELATTALFAGRPGRMVHVLGLPDRADPRRGQAFTLGIHAFVACSLNAGDKRFVLLVAYDAARQDLEAKAAQLERVSHAMQPVLQRKLHDEKLELLSSALEATYDAVCILAISPTDASRHSIAFVNAAFSAQTGYAVADILGKLVRDFLNAGRNEPELPRIRAAMQRREPVRAEVAIRRADGSVFWAEHTVVPMRDRRGETTHFVVIQRDITQRRAEAEVWLRREDEMLASAQLLCEATERLTRTQRIAKLGSWRRKLGEDAMEWTEAVYPMFGVTPENFKPGVEACWALIHPDDHHYIHERMETVDRTGIGYQVEYRSLGADGVLRHLWTDCVAERDERGEVVALNGIIQDITERKQAEAMLLRAEKLRSIGQLTGGIAHDFNNLLTVISINLEMLADSMQPGSHADDLRSMALRAAQSGARLTTSLLSFARRQPLQPEALDVAALLTEFQQMASHSLGERYPINLQIAPGLQHCLLDRAGFEGAMLNLLVNSRDAMPDGGVITVAAEPRLVDRPIAMLGGELAAGHYVVITVADSGTGIPAELQEKVFEPFFTTKPVGKGSGLGLSSVIGFVRQSGGEVELASEAGQGTIVRLFLPALAADS